MSEPRFLKAEPIVDFPRVESEIQRFWKQNRIFEKSLEIRQGRPKFVFYEGPPTANGLPHNGHVLTRVFKDIFLRYRTMRGFYVPRKAGWDTHGLPVEVEVEKELGIHGKEAIEQYGVEKFIKKCMSSVFVYTEEWERMTERVGFWVNLEDAYVTYHKSYVESVWWALSELFRKGLLYQGHKIVWWWPQGGTALSSGEVGLGYKTVDDPSVYVALELLDEPGTFLLVWTTTPWTLPSNQFVAVRPDYDYVQVKDGDHRLIIAAALRETIEGKLGRELPVDKEMKGAALLGRRYKPPFDEFHAQYKDLELETLEGKSEPVLWKVLAADFVELDSGTGLVHEAPAFGEVDYDLFRKTAAGYKEPEKVPLLCPVDPAGKFTSEIGSVAGVFVKEADRTLIQIMRDKGILLHREQYRHEYPFCWRADDDPLIQYARPAWFIRTTERNKEALENNSNVNWLPDHIGTGRFGDFLRNNVDWALSRERYWGTPLNVWINDLSGKIQAPSSAAEILAKNPRAFDHFHAAKRENPELSDHLMVHKPWIDEVTWSEPGEEGVYRRVPEVIDCWFDSGCVPFAQWGFPHQGVDDFKSSFPADYITEAIDQTRGWFYSQLMVATLLFDEECRKRLGIDAPAYPRPFKTCIVLGHVTDPEGKKESKSKGNYTPPEAIFDRVAQEFAVISPEQAELELEAGQVLIAKEDLEALDLNPGDKLQASRGDAPAQTLTLAVDRGKRLPRRVAVVSEADRAALMLSPCPAGTDVQPNAVPRLPAAERLRLEASGGAPGADAFRWFFFAANPPWSNKRHSLANVRAIQKEFPLKLRNVYSFFTIYAEIDEFDPTKHTGRAAAERTLLDRWILSELSLLTVDVTRLMDEFSAYEAASRLNEFVDGLSNWYLRRSRRRYWKSEFDADKEDAYATLYECLTAVIRLAAPFVPFMTEEIYQNVVRRGGDGAPESVHLCDLPEADESRIDKALSEEMAVVRDVVSLGLRVRTEHRLKVRQPLAGAEIVLTDLALQKRLESYRHLIEDELNVAEARFVRAEDSHVRYLATPNFRALGPRLGKKMPLAKKAFAAADAAALRVALLATGKAEIVIDGEAVALDADDVAIRVEAAENFAAAGDAVTVVVLNTDLSDELREQGLYRELLHHVQNFRKDLNIDYTARVRLSISGSEKVERVVSQNAEHFKEETLCVELRTAPDSWPNAETRELDVDGETVEIVLAQA